MKKIIIFGTTKIGLNVEKYIKRENACVIAYIDNNYKKIGEYYNNKITISPKDISTYNYDYIIIAVNKYLSSNYDSILYQLSDLNIPKMKIIEVCADNSERYDELSKYINIDLVNYENINLKMQEQEVYLNNIKYEMLDELQNGIIEIPNIIDIETTIKQIIENNKSIARFGDGELALIFGQDVCRFQNVNECLSTRLKEILKSNNENILIGLANFFGGINQYSEGLKKTIRKFLYNYDRDKIYKLLDMNKKYYDAHLFRPYCYYKNKSRAKKIFNMIKEIWDNRDIVIIEGEYTRLGIGNDLFSNAKSISRIITLNKNAFSKYEDILKEANKINKNKLILIALGPMATVLAYDLANIGYQAIDIGHIDIEYEHFLMKANDNIRKIKNKFNNEAIDEDRDEIPIYGENLIKYRGEIIAEIL